MGYSTGDQMLLVTARLLKNNAFMVCNGQMIFALKPSPDSQLAHDPYSKIETMAAKFTEQLHL